MPPSKSVARNEMPTGELPALATLDDEAFVVPELLTDMQRNLSAIIGAVADGAAVPGGVLQIVKQDADGLPVAAVDVQVTSAGKLLSWRPLLDGQVRLRAEPVMGSLRRVTVEANLKDRPVVLVWMTTELIPVELTWNDIELLAIREVQD